MAAGDWLNILLGQAASQGDSVSERGNYSTISVHTKTIMEEMRAYYVLMICVSRRGLNDVYDFSDCVRSRRR